VPAKSETSPGPDKRKGEATVWEGEKVRKKYGNLLLLQIDDKRGEAEVRKV